MPGNRNLRDGTSLIILKSSAVVRAPNLRIFTRSVTMYISPLIMAARVWNLSPLQRAARVWDGWDESKHPRKSNGLRL